MAKNDKSLGTIETGDGAESFDYLESQAVEELSLAEVEAIWDLVPTEDRDYLLRRYRRSLKQQGISSDEQEVQLADAYLQRYQYEGLVPAGEQWVRISATRRQQLKTGETDVADVDDEEGGGIPWLTIALVSFGIFLLIFVLTRILSGREDDLIVAADATVTATPTLTPTQTASPVPTVTPTPSSTPIALVESDTFISAGDGRNREFFPVQLQVRHPDDDQPRVFIVQERIIALTEWSFDPNPDVASWISGTSVRPVLGIPYSESNQDFIESLTTGTEFVLRMNTGSELLYRFSAGAEYGRQDTSLFRQGEPGIVLVLIGELGADNLPTSTRSIVTGIYDPSIELDLSAVSALPAAPGAAVTFPDLSVAVDDAYLLPIPNGQSDEFIVAVLDVILIAGERDVSLSAYQWFLDTDEARYSPDLSLSSGTSYDAMPLTLAAGQTIHASITFLVNRFSGDALLLVAPPGMPAEAFLLAFHELPPAISVENLDVQLRRIRRANRQVFVDVRIYNPQSESVSLELHDISMIFGFTPLPTGPSSRPIDFESLLFEPEFALDVTLTFDWNGDDPFASLNLAGRLWSISIVE